MQFVVDAENIEEAINKLLKKKRLESFGLNKLQLHLYGEDRLQTFDDLMLRKIVTESRGCGKTTAVALQIISDAIWHPNTPISICDSSNPRMTDFQFAFNQFADVVEDVISKLGLKFMVIDRVSKTLTLEI